MKRLMIAGTLGGLVLAAALTVATASSNDASAQTTEASTAEEVVETVLDRLVASGIITEDRAQEIAEKIYANERFQRWAENGLPEMFDDERFEDRLDKGLDRLAEAGEKYGDLDREELRERFAELRERHRDAVREFQERRRSLGNSELREQLSEFDRDEIRDAIENGTLDELIDTEALADSMLERAEEALDRAVENGRITQDEADEKLAELAERLEQLRNGEVDWSESFTKRWRDGKRGAEESGPGA